MEDVLETAAVLNTVNVGVAPDVDDLLDGAVMKGVVDGVAGVEDFIAVLKSNTASETTVIGASSLLLGEEAQASPSIANTLWRV